MLWFDSYLLRFHLASDWSWNNKHSRNFLRCSRFYRKDCNKLRHTCCVTDCILEEVLPMYVIASGQWNSTKAFPHLPASSDWTANARSFAIKYKINDSVSSAKLNQQRILYLHHCFKNFSKKFHTSMPVTTCHSRKAHEKINVTELRHDPPT